MLSQVDPALAAFCEKIAAEGGPVFLPDDLRDSLIFQAPVVQMVTMTRVSARLRNVQPEVNLDQSYEALKRTKKGSDAAQTGNTPKLLVAHNLYSLYLRKIIYLVIHCFILPHHMFGLSNLLYDLIFHLKMFLVESKMANSKYIFTETLVKIVTSILTCKNYGPCSIVTVAS